MVFSFPINFFSDQIVFSYGLSDSPLPFGSAAAVVKVSDSSGDVSASSCDSPSSEFVLEYLLKEENFLLAAIDVVLEIATVEIQMMLLNVMSVWIVHPVVTER